MDSMIIQIGPKSGLLSNTVKCTEQIFNIGRSFKSDLVLSDPFLAPNQLRLRKNQSDWFIDVLDDTNPVFVNGKLLKQSQVKLNSGDWVTVGRTVLRFFSDDHQMEKARKLIFSNFYHLNVWKLILPLLLLFALITGVNLFTDWLESYVEIEWKELLLGTLMLHLVIIVWALVWGIIGKLFRHQNQFLIQLFVTAGVFLIASIIELLFSPIDYMTNSMTIGTVVEYAISYITLAILLYFNYSIATNLRKPLFVACMVSVLTFATFYGLEYLDKKPHKHSAEYMRSLQPPIFKWQADQTMDEYLSSQEALFESIEFEDDDDETE